MESAKAGAGHIRLTVPELTVAQWFVVAIFALGLGCANVFGGALESDDGALAHGKLGLLALLVRAILTGAVYLIPFSYLWAFAINATSWSTTARKFPARKFSARGFPAAVSPLKHFVILWAVLAVFWLPYWVFLWPGITPADTWSQLRQAVGLAPYNTHHPLAHTLGIGLPFRWFLSFTHNATVSVSLVSLLQLIILAAVVALSSQLLFALPVPAPWRWTVVAFFALNPLVGWYSVVLLKDVWLAASVFLLCSSAVLVLWKLRQGHSVSVPLWILFAASLASVPLMKKTGLYIAVPVLVVFVLLSVGRRRNALLVGICALSFGVGLNAAIAHALNAAPGSARELFSLPSQQISRVIRDHPEVLTAGDRELVQRYYPNADLGNLYGDAYNQKVADAAKGALDVAALEQSPLEYWQLLESLCSKAMGSCLTATARSTLGYWYPGPVDYRIVMHEDWSEVFSAQTQDTPNAGKDQANALLSGGVDTVPDRLHLLRSQVADFVTHGMTRVPVVGWLFLPGAWSWAAVAMGFVALARRRWLALLPLTAALFSVALCLVSPVYAEVRYALPTLFVLPVLVTTTFVSCTRSRTNSAAGVSITDGDVNPVVVPTKY